jgi:NADP-dependent 3-hydroxy acid dehydrogenase YdfG
MLIHIMFMEKNYQRTALVTGGSNGIGNAIATKLAAEKWRVVIADIVPPASTHKNITYVYCDITRRQDVDNLFKSILKAVTMPDVLVLNAGKGIHELLAEGDPEKWQQVIDLNVMGTLRCIRAFVPQMLKNKKGDVVFISSVSSNKPYPYGSVYSASKTAVDIIAETLRLETEPFLRITSVKAGTADTGFFQNSGRESYDMRQVLSAKDIAEDVWYALNKPQGTTINTIVTRPAGQLF